MSEFKAVPKLWVVLLPVSVCVACANPDPTPDREQANAGARAILDSIQVAAGGMGLADVRTIAVQYVHTSFRGPDQDDDSPSQARSIDVVQVRDFDNGRQFYERRAAGETGAWERVVIVPGAAFRINLRTDETTVFTPDAASSALYSGLEARWYVYSVLNDALFSAASLEQRADTMVGDEAYHVIRFRGSGTETNEIWVQPQDFRIARRYIEASDPVTGLASTVIDYSDYEVIEYPTTDTTSSLPLPMTVSVTLDGEPFELFEMQDVRVNAVIQDSAFEPPVR